AGALPGGERAGLYTGEWTGAGLEEKVYAVAITVTDIAGHSVVDKSLTFSDPAAGNSTPGTTTYPNHGMTRTGAEVLQLGDVSPRGIVMDAANGYAYMGTASIPARVVKVALGSGTSTPTRVNSLDLPDEDGGINCAAIDTANGYAYFATQS